MSAGASAQVAGGIRRSHCVPPTSPTGGSPVRRNLVTIMVACAALAVSIPAAHARPHAASVPPASCTVAGSVVNATGLPTDEVVNFMVTDNTGTTGWVLGFTTDGNWSVAVPTATGPTSYQFVSRTWGPNGTHYTIFATCA